MSGTNKRKENDQTAEELLKSAVDDESDIVADANESELCAEETPQSDAADEKTLLIEKLTAEKAEYLQLAQYLKADFENYKKRSQKMICDSTEDGKREAVKAMLPIADNLQLCVDNALQEDPFVQGVQKTLRQLHEVFAGLGVEEIAALGEPFDPNLHDAVMQIQAECDKAGIVVEVLRKGYTMNGKVLRHSMVKVSA